MAVADSKRFIMKRTKTGTVLKTTGNESLSRPGVWGLSGTLRLSPRLFRCAGLGFLTSFPGAKLGDTLDQLRRNGLGQRKPQRPLAMDVRIEGALERRDEGLACGIQRVMLLPPAKYSAARPCNL